MDRDIIGGQSYLCYLYDISTPHSSLRCQFTSEIVFLYTGVHITCSPAPSLHSEAPTGSGFWARNLDSGRVCKCVYLSFNWYCWWRWRHSWVSQRFWSTMFGLKFRIWASELREQFQNKSFYFPQNPTRHWYVYSVRLFFYVQFWLYFISGKNILFLFVSLVDLICPFRCVPCTETENGEPLWTVEGCFWSEHIMSVTWSKHQKRTFPVFCFDFVTIINVVQPPANTDNV